MLRRAYYAAALMLLLGLLFALGIANFALHKAVLESGHPLIAQVPWFFQLMGGRFSMLVEFIMLAGAMILVDAGSEGWAWGYAAYTMLNITSAWLILSDRL